MINVIGEQSIFKFFRLPDHNKKSNNKLSEFYAQKNSSEEISIELNDRARVVVKRAKELKKGIKMLPDDLPTEFRKAIDDTINSLTEDIQNEAKDIVDSADEARANTDNTLYALRRESERYEKKVRNIDRICSVPLVGTLGDKASSNLHTTLEELMELSSNTNTYYESLLYSRNLVKDLVKEEEPE